MTRTNFKLENGSVWTCHGEESIVALEVLHQNGRFSILVLRYLLGQFRIQITDRSIADPDEPVHGSIVQEMCTYNAHRALLTIGLLTSVEDPLELARSWARPWNCDSVGGRIRLDTVQEVTIEEEV